MNDFGVGCSSCSQAKIDELEKEEAAGWPGCNPMLIKTKLKELKAARAKLSIKDGKHDRQGRPFTHMSIRPFTHVFRST